MRVRETVGMGLFIVANTFLFRGKGGLLQFRFLINRWLLSSFFWPAFLSYLPSTAILMKQFFSIDAENMEMLITGPQPGVVLLVIMRRRCLGLCPLPGSGLSPFTTNFLITVSPYITNYSRVWRKSGGKQGLNYALCPDEVCHLSPQTF